MCTLDTRSELISVVPTLPANPHVCLSILFYVMVELAQPETQTKQALLFLYCEENESHTKQQAISNQPIARFNTMRRWMLSLER